MPKKTNDFQSLIKFIYDQITSQGGKVSESAMVYDKDSESLREVDILIEQNVSGHEIKIAIECRDRSRKDTIEWIDSLIGKASSLKVDKVVAVSKNGFTSNAIKKAKLVGIETITLDEASEKDWNSGIIKTGIVLITEEQFKLLKVMLPQGVDLNSTIIISDLNGTVNELVEMSFRKKIGPDLIEAFNKNRSEYFDNLEDLKTPIFHNAVAKFTGIKVEREDGIFVNLDQIDFVIESSRKLLEVPQNHFKYQDKIVSIGNQSISVDDSVLTKTIQDPITKNIRLNLSTKKLAKIVENTNLSIKSELVKSKK